MAEALGRLVAGAIATVVVALVTAGCAAESATRDPTLSLPPGDLAGLNAVLGEVLSTDDLTLTRASLVDRSGGGYEPSPNGRHLALYVARPDGTPLETYVDGIVALTARFGDEVFGRWPDLASFDICQEAPGRTEGEEAAVYTQVDISRAAFDAIAWARADLATMIVRNREDDSGLHMFAHDDLHAVPRLAEALQAAERVAPPS